MTHSLSAGIALTLVAGLISGNCLLPMKFHRRWKWENSWFAFSIVSRIVLPWALGLSLISHLFHIYASLPIPSLLIPLLFGADWGIAQVLFCISVDRLGLGLAYAVIVGLGALLGMLVPLFVQHRAQVSELQILYILLGVALMVTGISLCARGGQLRESRQAADSTIHHLRGYYSASLFAILCGVMAPMLNYALALGESIADEAITTGNPQVRAAYAV